MKNSLKKSLIEMTAAEQSKRLQQLGKDIIAAKMQLAMGTLKNVHQIKNLKKEMAFIKMNSATKGSEEK